MQRQLPPILKCAEHIDMIVHINHCCYTGVVPDRQNATPRCASTLKPGTQRRRIAQHRISRSCIVQVVHTTHCHTHEGSAEAMMPMRGWPRRRRPTVRTIQMDHKKATCTTNSIHQGVVRLPGIHIQTYFITLDFMLGPGQMQIL